ncbi:MULTISPECIES: class I SAM-dependent methyltransferase [unclassified Coleofasciculus]|uniref:class I SAM-dependent methyltransferase n=1 Tax=Cyanophyceae TaxID=3028117 RepID=UPI001689E648|nr:MULTISPECIES: class I SAM-dependent methyltransferase [unclassified Coleofasciculus]MBD1880332.1 class I SAM-dependent methyltransferase [Coleofasciculus sp. FACHB-T130]MBD2086676.1 class I SAM-dependent methyltransferase [Coleofasciculus sp. FACHB-542]MBD2541166.1 class I SAM-dependent methyltransferase [Coleofasciculus sp. FACHB-SPT36]
MNDQASELLERIRQQFDFGPYPRIPIDKSPKDNPNYLFIHNLVTPYYLRNQKIIDTKEKLILDAGCGTGYKTLILAEANPGAKIVGIDISEESIKLAQQRLTYHGFENTEFHILSLYDLPKLRLKFDYINCDELLYLFPDISVGLAALKSILKPKGIIRSNLHSSLQRFTHYRTQEVFKMMGLMDSNPEEMEIEIAVETMKALKDGVDIKAKTWNPSYEKEDGKEGVLMNYLFQGDKGYTIPDLFAALRAADLEFISMVNWRHWDVTDLFNEPENLPAFWGMSLPEVSTEERLHLFELMHPVHRLLDFWCGHSSHADSFTPVEQWELSDWQAAKVHLHPQLRTSQVKEDLLKCLVEQKAFEISGYVTHPAMAPVQIDSSILICLLPLWEEPKPVKFLTERWLKVKPLNPVTLEPVTFMEALNEVKELLSKLDFFRYVLLELSA